MTSLKYMVDRVADRLTNPEEWRKEWLEERDGVWDEDIEPGAPEWLEESLDVKYLVDSRLNLLAGIVVVATGGPHIEVDFRDHCVKGYWGGERYDRYFIDNLGVEESLEDLYELARHN